MVEEIFMHEFILEVYQWDITLNFLQLQLNNTVIIVLRQKENVNITFLPNTVWSYRQLLLLNISDMTTVALNFQYKFTTGTFINIKVKM